MEISPNEISETQKFAKHLVVLHLVLTPISGDFPNYEQRKSHYQNHLSHSTNVIEQATRNNSNEIMGVETIQKIITNRVWDSNTTMSDL